MFFLVEHLQHTELSRTKELLTFRKEGRPTSLQESFNGGAGNFGISLDVFKASDYFVCIHCELCQIQLYAVSNQVSVVFVAFGQILVISNQC